MKTRDELVKGLAPVGVAADFSALRQGSLALLTPLSEAGRDWLAHAVGPDARWAGPTLLVELRYFADLVDAIIDHGFLFEREISLH